MKKGICISFILLILAIATQSFSAPQKNNSTNFFLDILLWKLREGSADNWAQNISSAGVMQSATIRGVPFGFKPGIRIGVDFQKKNQDWDTKVFYTGYQTEGTDQAAGRIFSSFLGNFFANNTQGNSFGPHYDSASIRWKFFYNTVDLELGHAFEMDDIFRAHPFVGFKAAAINQDMDSTWKGPNKVVSGVDVPITTFTSATENLRNDFWGFGPSMGVDTEWPINFFALSKHSFCLIGDFSSALLWGHWNFKDVYHNDAPTTISIHLSDIGGGATMARALLGIEWKGYMRGTDVKIRLGYEAQIWFNQMQFYSFNVGRLNNLMSLQGGSLDFNFNFK